MAFMRYPLGIMVLFLTVIYGIAGYVLSNGFYKKEKEKMNDL